MEIFQERLNQIVPKLISEELLENKGLGNEIGFYIFDYPPERELEVRSHIQFTLSQISKKRSDLRVKHINLFTLIIEYLNSRNLLDKAIEMQIKKGDEKLLAALKAPLAAEKIAGIFSETAQPQDQDLILISGVGNAYPMIRSHNLLNNLHPLMGDTPLVMFFPGRFTGYGLSLFGKLEESNYYRAFQLVP
jgi:hypothetical protein